MMTYFLLRLAIVLSLFAFAEWALAIERNPGFAFGYQLTGGPSVTNGEAGAGTVASGSADLLIGGKQLEDHRHPWHTNLPHASRFSF